MKRSCRALPAATSLLGFVLTAWSFWPGHLSFDSLVQLREARAGQFTDWHPPAMAALWRGLDFLLPGPGGMLLLHLGLFWGGLYLIFTRIFPKRPWRAAALTLLMGIYPPVLGLIGTVWKDVGMLAALTFAFGATLAARDAMGAGRRTWIAAGALALLYATLVRHNAIFAVIPLAWALATALPRRRKLSYVALCAGLALAPALVQRALVAESGRTFVHQNIWLHDLTAISLAERENLFPPAWRAGQGYPETLDELRAVYREDGVTSLSCCDATTPRFRMARDRVELRELERAWWSAIARAPGAYLHHRWMVTRSQFGIARDLCNPYHPGIDPNPEGIALVNPGADALLMRVPAAFRETVLFRGWFHLLFCAGALAVLWRGGRIAGRNRGPCRALAASGLAYAGAYFFISTSCDFRMLCWLVMTSALLQGIVLLASPRR